MKKIVIKRTARNFINCCIIDENEKEYSIGFNNNIYIIFKTIKDNYYNKDEIFNNYMFDAFHKGFFYNFNTIMRQRAHIVDMFSIKYFYKLMWSKLYDMLFVSYKYFDSIDLTFVPSNYIFESDLSFYMIKFLEKYFNIIVDNKIRKWIINYCNATFKEEKVMDNCNGYLFSDGTIQPTPETLTKLYYDNEPSVLEYFNHNKMHSNIISEIKLSKDKKKDICYMVVIWNDKTITKTTLPINPKDILPSFKTGNNFQLITSLPIPTPHRNTELKDIWNDDKKVKFLFNSFLICYLKQKYPKIKINSLLECVLAFDILANIMDANNKLFDLLSIIVKMNDETYYKIMYKAFFN